MKRKIVTCLLCFHIAFTSIAQNIDSAFTTNGFLPYGGPLSNDKQNDHGATNTIIQPDGKLVVAENYKGATADLSFYTYRYNHDGTPDVTFGTNGVSAIFCGSESENRDIVLQPDGKIVAVGATEYCILGVCGALQFVMLRIETNGNLDTTFGYGGKLITTDIFGGTGLFALPKTLKMLPDGKFIVGGKGPGGYPFVARLKNNGRPDTTFGINGVYADSVTQTMFEDLAVNNAGEVFALLDKYNYTTGVGSDTNNLYDNYIFKLTASGARDNTFGTAGRLVFSVSNSDHPRSIAVRNNQSIVVVGDENFNNTENYNWNGTGGTGYGFTNKGYIAFINKNGTMASHIPGGFKSIKLPADTSTFFQKVTVLNDNRFAVSGRVIRPISGNYQEKAALAQIDSNGNLITEFHTNGYWIFDYGVSGTTGWPGRLCAFNDVDVTAANEVFATGYRNHTAANTGTCLFLLKLKDVPTGSTPTTDITLRSVDNNIVSVYPNPVDDVLSIKVNEHTSYAIYDMGGRRVSTGKLQKGKNEITLPGSAASGVYFLSDDRTGEVVRFIKK